MKFSLRPTESPERIIYDHKFTKVQYLERNCQQSNTLLTEAPANLLRSKSPNSFSVLPNPSRSLNFTSLSDLTFNNMTQKFQALEIFRTDCFSGVTALFLPSSSAFSFPSNGFPSTGERLLSFSLKSFKWPTNLKVDYRRSRCSDGCLAI